VPNSIFYQLKFLTKQPDFMRKNLLLSFLVFFSVVFAITAQERKITGKVTSSEERSGLPGVSIQIKGTSKGVQTDANGAYTVMAPEGATLVYSYIGLLTQEVAIGNRSVIDIELANDSRQLNEVVVTALGVKRSEKSLTYASQGIKDENLNTIRQTNLNNAIAGKVAGIQVRSQSAVALGRDASIRIRGAGSLNDKAPLYILDGNPVGSADINLDDVENVNVLKGPAATALYGQRGDAGVILMTTKKGGANKGIGLEINQSTFVDNVYILPKYQNSYAGGASADLIKFAWEAGMPDAWKALDGKYYNEYSDDSSWGPRLVGQDYIPWYAWYPGTEYSYKTTKLLPNPGNIKDFFQQQIATNTNINFSKSGDNFSTRISATAQNQNGMLYNSKGTKYTVAVNNSLNLSPKVTVGLNLNYVDYTIKGQFDDAYSNNSTGSFNSWFHRHLDFAKLKELKDLRSAEGILASWNHNNPGAILNSPLDFYGGNYWYNPYTFFERIDNTESRRRLFGDVNLTYALTKDLKISGFARMNNGNGLIESKTPNILQNSATQTGLKAAYGTGQYYGNFTNNIWKPNETNFELQANYNKRFNDVISLDAMAGANLRKDVFRVVGASTVDGLVVPDYFALSNSVSTVSTNQFRSKKEVRSVYGSANLGYKDFLYLQASIRNDKSSALPLNANSYTYPSVGASIVFSEFLRTKLPALSYGKVRASWAQVGSDLDPYLLALNYSLDGDKFDGNALMNTPNALPDANIKPALSSSYEFGIDLKFLKDRYGVSATYYNEDKVDEIINVPIAGASGYTSKLINAGKLNRHGLELSFNATPVKSKNFTWNSILNWAKNTSTVDALAEGVDAIIARGADNNLAQGAFSGTSGASTVHQVGQKWGQIRGGGFTYKDGVKVVSEDGIYVANPNQYLGSVLPDFTGGFVNTFDYKAFTLNANIEFSKGGKYYSLSDAWGSFSGLLARTAELNDKGNPLRDPVADGGGVHVVGVTIEGKAVDKYVDAQTYFHQFRTNRIAEEHVYDMSFVKVREVSLGYKIPVKAVKFINRATVSLVARNPWLVYAKNRDFDPSEISNIYGENGQFPGTRSYGVNVKLGF
jgi:TonB-linked SusC/RagA family outer membrane protein